MAALYSVHLVSRASLDRDDGHVQLLPVVHRHCYLADLLGWPWLHS